MKKVLSLLVFGLALLVACEKEEIPTTVNEVTDLYTVPADAIELPAPTAESVWATDRRYFNLTFGNVLSTSIVGYDALLPSGQFSLGEDAIGNAVLAKTKVNGQAAKNGYITVNDNGGDYSFSAVIDGVAYYWKGKLPFKADPAPKQLKQVLQAQSNVANGTKSVTLQLATDGISKGYNEQWQEVWTGEGGYLALDLYSEDGYLHDGSYVACATGGAIEPGQFGIGWDPGDLYGIGWIFTDWGTCWWTVKDGAATAEKITDGIVSVSREGDDWVIAWGSKYPQEVVFKGPIPALTKPDAPTPGGGFDYVFTEADLQPVTDQAGNVVSGVLKHPITIMDKAGNEKAYLELLIAEGNTNYEGSYPSTSYASQAGQMADGWEFDGTAWGMGLMSGGSYYVNEDGDKVLMYAGQYTVEVKQLAVGAYEFICSAFDYKAAGPDYVPGDDPGTGGDGDDGSDLSGIVLKITSGLTYTMEDVTAANTSADGSALSGMTLWKVTVSDGSGTVAAFDLGTKAGSEDLTGTYTVMSYPDAVGKAGNGWGFAAWNMFGGCYYKVDGAYYFIPVDATITVSANSDNTLKFKFSGSIQKDDYSDGGQGGLLLNNVAKG